MPIVIALYTTTRIIDMNTSEEITKVRLIDFIILFINWLQWELKLASSDLIDHRAEHDDNHS